MKKYKLWEITNIINWYPFQSSKFNRDWKWFLVIRIQDIDNWPSNNSKYRDLDFPKNVLVDEWDVLVSLSWSFKIEKRNFWKALLNQRIIKIKPNENILNKKYMLYILKTKLDEIKTRATNTSIPNISVNDIKNLGMPLPLLAIQHTIVARLDQIQELIDLKNQALSKTDELAKAIFLEMFGDPMTNEKEREMKELKEFWEVKTWNTPSRKSTQYYWNFIEWIKSDNINTPDMFLTKADEYLSEAWITHWRVVNQWSVLVTCIAWSLSCIGNVAIANRKVAFNQQINAITPFKNKTNEYYLYALIENSKVYIQNHSTNSMKWMLSKWKFELIKFPLPPLPLQQQFADIITEIEAQKTEHKQALAKLEELYQAEMQRSFSL